NETDKKTPSGTEEYILDAEVDDNIDDTSDTEAKLEIGTSPKISQSIFAFGN
ncbi:MAG: hypothetical protein MHPSP_000190, partial [Paramarteilia canceri]